MNYLLLVAAGASAGALSRVGLTRLIESFLPSAMPYGTIGVNLLGCLIIGVVWAFMQRSDLPVPVTAFVLSGYVASFTTFSTFSLQTVDLLQSDQVGLALANVAISNVGGIALVLVGYFLTKSIIGAVTAPSL